MLLRGMNIRRFQSTFKLDHELKNIERVAYLKSVNKKQLFPSSVATNDKIFPQLETITNKDLVPRRLDDGTRGVYSISRTSGGRIPVYSNIRRGNVRETIIRRIQGDVVLLKGDLQKALPEIDSSKFKVVQESKKIVIKGDHVAEVRNVLFHSMTV